MHVEACRVREGLCRGQGVAYQLADNVLHATRGTPGDGDAGVLEGAPDSGWCSC